MTSRNSPTRAATALPPVAEAEPTSVRDLRIDLLRGLALVMIFINHIPDNALGLFTSRNFGFSDAAEAFVLISGISAALAYSPRRSPGARAWSPLSPWRRAFTLWWVQALIVLSIYLMIRWSLPLPGVAEMAATRNVTPVLQDPTGLLAPLLLLTHQFNCADILPLYILLLLATPALLGAARHWPMGLLAISGLLWASAAWWSVNLRTWPTDHGWFFNPLSWQFLYVIGLVIGVAKHRGARLVPVRMPLVLVAGGVVIGSALWMQIPALADRGTVLLQALQDRMGSPDVMTSFDKTFLAPLRLIHILALAYLLSAWPGLHRIARSRWMKAFVVIGRNALPAFATASILAYAIQILREVLLPPLPVDLLLIGAGLNVMLLVALILDRWKRRA